MPGHGRHVAAISAVLTSMLGLACAQSGFMSQNQEEVMRKWQEDLRKQKEPGDWIETFGHVFIVVWAVVFLGIITVIVRQICLQARMTSASVIEYGKVEHQHAITFGTPVPATAYSMKTGHSPLPSSSFLEAQINYPAPCGQTIRPDIPGATTV